MKRKVTGKQENSKHCVVCGLENPFGLRARFYETEDGQLVALFRAGAHHQGYPGRLHGGIASAILDETMGRAVNVGRAEMVWGVTVDLQVKYRKPLPLGEELRAVCRVTAENARFFEGSGDIYLPSGELAVCATGRYMRLPLDKIADFDAAENDWRVVPDGTDPAEVEA